MIGALTAGGTFEGGGFVGDVVGLVAVASTQLSKCVVFTQLDIALPDVLHDEQVVESQT